MAYLLKQWRKKYTIIVPDEKIEQKYDFMWGFEQIQTINSQKNKSFDAAILLDVPSIERIGKPAKLMPPVEFRVKIDHHPVEEEFAKYNLVEIKVSSTSNLVYELISHSKIQFDANLASLIFSGIMYDTGRFSFSNTNQRDFEIAAELTGFGVKANLVANSMFFNNTMESMKTIGYGLANMESHLKGRFAIIYLPLEIMQKNNHAEIEEMANYSVSVRNVEVGVFIREIKPNFMKVSFRSKGRINVNSVAKAFGGGGHLHAAGCRFTGKYQDLRKKLIEEVAKHL
jgi:phosphoesterase RecJ-like protein